MPWNADRKGRHISMLPPIPMIRSSGAPSPATDTRMRWPSTSIISALTPGFPPRVGTVGPFRFGIAEREVVRQRFARYQEGMDDVWVIGAGMTRFAKSDLSLREIAASAA